MKRRAVTTDSECRPEIERMLKNSQTKVLVPVITLGLVREHAVRHGADIPMAAAGFFGRCLLAGARGESIGLQTDGAEAVCAGVVREMQRR